MPTEQRVAERRQMHQNCIELRMGLFDFDAFRGGGSGKETLDEEWEKQQAILRDRRGHLSKDQLQKKYKSATKNVENKSGSARNPAAAAVKSKETKKASSAKPKFFWEK